MGHILVDHKVQLCCWVLIRRGRKGSFDESEVSVERESEVKLYSYICVA